MLQHELTTSGSNFAHTKFTPATFVAGAADSVREIYSNAASSLSPYLAVGFTALSFFASITGNINIPNVTQRDPSISNNISIPRKVSKSIPVKLAHSFDQMLNYAKLGDGWDGVGSVAPDLRIIARALAFLSLLPDEVPAPEAMVAADGDAGWFWDSEQVRASVVFTHNDRFAYYGKHMSSNIVARGTDSAEHVYVPQSLVGLFTAA